MKAEELTASGVASGRGVGLAGVAAAQGVAAVQGGPGLPGAQSLPGTSGTPVPAPVAVSAPAPVPAPVPVSAPVSVPESGVQPIEEHLNRVVEDLNEVNRVAAALGEGREGGVGGRGGEGEGEREKGGEREGKGEGEGAMAHALATAAVARAAAAEALAALNAAMGDKGGTAATAAVAGNSPAGAQPGAHPGVHTGAPSGSGVEAGTSAGPHPGGSAGPQVGAYHGAYHGLYHYPGMGLMSPPSGPPGTATGFGDFSQGYTGDGHSPGRLREAKTPGGGSALRGGKRIPKLTPRAKLETVVRSKPIPYYIPGKSDSDSTVGANAAGSQHNSTSGTVALDGAQGGAWDTRRGRAEVPRDEAGAEAAEGGASDRGGLPEAGTPEAHQGVREGEAEGEEWGGLLYDWGQGVLKPHKYVLALPAVQYPYPEGEDASYREACALAGGSVGEREGGNGAELSGSFDRGLGGSVWRSFGAGVMGGRIGPGLGGGGLSAFLAEVTGKSWGGAGAGEVAGEGGTGRGKGLGREGEGGEGDDQSARGNGAKVEGGVGEGEGGREEEGRGEAGEGEEGEEAGEGGEEEREEGEEGEGVGQGGVQKHTGDTSTAPHNTPPLRLPSTPSSLHTHTTPDPFPALANPLHTHASPMELLQQSGFMWTPQEEEGAYGNADIYLGANFDSFEELKTALTKYSIEVSAFSSLFSLFPVSLFSVLGAVWVPTSTASRSSKRHSPSALLRCVPSLSTVFFHLLHLCWVLCGYQLGEL